MKPFKCVIELENDDLNNIFNGGTNTQFEEFMAGIEDFLGVGAVVKVSKNGAITSIFKAPGEFIDYVNNQLGNQINCPRCGHAFSYNPQWLKASMAIGCPKCGEQFKASEVQTRQ